VQTKLFEIPHLLRMYSFLLCLKNFLRSSNKLGR
jgi:hypothetical protein